MSNKLIEDHLTHYRPELKAELISSGELQDYIENQAAAMAAARERILRRLQEKEPHLSQLQREMEADQMVREMFLPVG